MALLHHASFCSGKIKPQSIVQDFFLEQMNVYPQVLYVGTEIKSHFPEAKQNHSANPFFFPSFQCGKAVLATSAGQWDQPRGAQDNGTSPTELNSWFSWC